MAEDSQSTHRRRRRRATSREGAPPVTESAESAEAPTPHAREVTEAVHPGGRTEAVPQAPPRRQRAPRDSGERGLRDLVGAGQSQLGVSGALRGRDVNRPTDEDLAEAEAQLVIVRRHWQPLPQKK